MTWFLWQSVVELNPQHVKERIVVAVEDHDPVQHPVCCDILLVGVVREAIHAIGEDGDRVIGKGKNPCPENVLLSPVEVGELPAELLREGDF